MISASWLMLARVVMNKRLAAICSETDFNRSVRPAP